MSSYVNIVLLVAAGWLAIGVCLSILMGRRGHNGFGWFVVGALLGPLGLILAVDALRHDGEPEVQTVARRIPFQAVGPVDVLVGYDGSPESAAALGTVEDLFGERTGRIVVATVVSLDDVASEEREAEKGLRRLAGRLPDRTVGIEVLHGHPSAALRERAAAGGFDLLVIGTRGKGLTKALMGSAAKELVRDSKVPVLVVGKRPAGAA